MAKKVIIVSNKREHDKDYSGFVDSCDVVVRVNKLDNIDDGKTGTKTDIAVVWPNVSYWKYTPQQQHIAIVRNVERLYLIGPQPAAIDFCKRYNIRKYFPYPPELMPFVGIAPHFWTACAKAVKLADTLFPEDELYFLGDIDCVTRSGFGEWDVTSDENTYLTDLVTKGRMKVLS